MSVSYQPYSSPSFGRVQGGVNPTHSPQKPEGQTDEIHSLLAQLSGMIQANLAGTMSKLKSGTLGFEDIGALKESMAQVEQFEAMSAQVALLDQAASGQPVPGAPAAPTSQPVKAPVSKIAVPPAAQPPVSKTAVPPTAKPPVSKAATPPVAKPPAAKVAVPPAANAPHGTPPRIDAVPRPVQATTAQGNRPPVTTRGAPAPVQGTANKPVAKAPAPHGATAPAPRPQAAAPQAPAKAPAKTPAPHVAVTSTKPQATTAQGAPKPAAVNAAVKPAAPSNTAGALSTQPQTKALSAAESKKVAAQYIQNLQKDFGLSKDEAAGIVANLWHESGGMNSGITQGGRIGAPNGNMADDNGNGYGIAQWGGVRKKGLIKYAKDHGLDPSSQAANYGFLKQELKGEYKYCIDAVKGKGLDGATKSFCTNFEKASDPQMGSRIALARQLSTTA